VGQQGFCTPHRDQKRSRAFRRVIRASGGRRLYIANAPLMPAIFVYCGTPRNTPAWGRTHLPNKLRGGHHQILAQERASKIIANSIPNYTDHNNDMPSAVRGDNNNSNSSKTYTMLYSPPHIHRLPQMSSVKVPHLRGPWGDCRRECSKLNSCADNHND